MITPYVHQGLHQYILVNSKQITIVYAHEDNYKYNPHNRESITSYIQKELEL